MRFRSVAVLTAAAVGTVLVGGPAQAGSVVRNGAVAWVGGSHQDARYGDVWVASRDGSGVHRVTSGGEFSSVRWSPDGTRMVVVRDNDHIQIRTVGGALVRNLARGVGPSWSPDGRSIAFTTGLAVFRVPAEGGTPVRLTAVSCLEGYLSAAEWSPRGDRLTLYGRCKTGDFDPNLWSFNLRTGVLTGRFDDANGNLNSVRWMPDGRSIVFVAACDGPTNGAVCISRQANVYTADLNTANRVAHTSLPGCPPGQHRCIYGYTEVAPGPDGHDYAVTYRSTAATTGTGCIRALTARLRYCSDTYIPTSPDWARQH